MKTDMGQTVSRIIGYVLLAIAVTICVSVLRMMTDGSRKLLDAERAMEKNDRLTAIEFLEDAAKAYVPGSRHVIRAHRELILLAKAAEIRGDQQTAIKAWESLRRSVIATRHIFQPNADVLKNANQAIVRIRTEQSPDFPPNDLIALPKDPLPFFSIMMFLGLLFWITGATLYTLRPMKKDNSFWISPVYSGITCIAGLAAWLLAVWAI